MCVLSTVLALEENTPLVNVVFLDEADLLSPQPSPQGEWCVTLAANQLKSPSDYVFGLLSQQWSAFLSCFLLHSVYLQLNVLVDGF